MVWTMTVVTVIAVVPSVVVVLALIGMAVEAGPAPSESAKDGQ